MHVSECLRTCAHVAGTDVDVEIDEANALRIKVRSVFTTSVFTTSVFTTSVFTTSVVEIDEANALRIKVRTILNKYIIYIYIYIFNTIL